MKHQTTIANDSYTEHDDVSESTDKSRQTNEANFVKIHESFIN